jgi:gamma-glutamyltranspeptidase/glutathione hydrolase
VDINDGSNGKERRMQRDFGQPGRSALIAGEAAIATSHPLASAAGLEVLMDGGNAVDAALAAVAVQCVAEAHMTGIGGDCFVLYAPAGRDALALNGSGRASRAASAEALTAQGLTAIPQRSPHAVTVPGAISAWCRLHDEHGSLPLDRLFARAILYAEEGYPVAPRVAWDWAEDAGFLAGDAGCRAVFLPGGRIPSVGDRHAQPLLGARLRDIAARGAAAFYEGAVAESLVRLLNAQGGLHTLDDFAAGRDVANWVDPIRLDYHGTEVVECPPNGQGLAALMILGLLSGHDLAAEMPEADRIHLHAEATKIAYHHRDALICDPDHLPHDPRTLLSQEVLGTLRRRIDPKRAGRPALWTEPEHRDTIYLCVVDRDGNAVSFINSIFDSFGSGLLDPETGVLLHSRGRSFRVEPGHPNAIGPGKRPMHTIIPGLLRRGGRTAGVFGVMGGHYQAAGQAQFVSSIIDRGLDPQAALDLPRSFAFDGVLQLETRIGESVAADLAGRGHKVAVRDEPLGGGQAILIDHERGVLIAGSDPRKDGCAMGV